MDDIKNLIRRCDYFGVGISFSYRTEKKYKSLFGGIIFLIFVIGSIAYSIVSLIQYVIDRPITVIYYKKELPKYDIYSLYELKTGIALKATCDNVDTNIYDIQKLLNIQMIHTKYERINEQRIKTETIIPLKKCEYSDFYNLLNSDLENNGLINDFLCFEKNNFTLSGFYLDKIFEYFEITVSIANESQNETLTKLLYNSECKISYFFTDYAIDVNNKSNPFRIYLNENFLPISPVQYKKLNLYFNIIEFSSYESHIFDLPINKKYGGHSKTESYELYEGENRYETKTTDYQKYAKIYIRVDSSRSIFERRYQKLTHLFASISSFLSCILMVLFFIITNLNNIFVINSVIKTIYRTRQEDFYRKQKFREVVKKRVSLKLIENLEEEKKNKSEDSKEEINKDNSNIKIYNKSPKLNIEHGTSINARAAIDKKIPKIKKLINKLIFNFICHVFPWSKKMDWEYKIIHGLTLSFYDQLDIYNYLKHLQMIKIISYITLNSREFYLIKHLSNPSISWGNKDFYQLTTDKMANIDNKMNDFWNIFEELLNKKNKNSREKKICNLICTDIHNILEK